MKLNYFGWLAVLLFIVIFAIYGFLYGTPWGKYQFKKEVKKYLEQKYQQEMVIVTNANYSFENGSYSIGVSPLDNDKITFGVYQDQGNKKRLGDNYIVNFWALQFNNEINSYLKEIYPGGEVEGKIVIQDNPMTYQPDEGTINSLPNYDEVKDQLKSGTYIFIDIDRALSKEITNIEYDNLYSVVNLIKQRNYSFDILSINYSLSESKEERIRLNYSEFSSLRDKEDLINYIE